jgi:rhodanese-related sulfurtransferase
MSAGRLLAALLLLGVVLAGCGGASTAEAAIELVAPSEAAQILEDRSPEVVLLDVRTAEEYSEAHVPGSVNIDFYAADFADQLDALPKDVPYVVYCRSGNRSGTTMDIMQDLGFTEVWDVDGGIIAWSQAGLPLGR